MSRPTVLSLILVLALLPACRSVESPDSYSGYTLIAFPGDKPAAEAKEGGDGAAKGGEAKSSDGKTADTKAGDKPAAKKGSDYHEIAPGLTLNASLRTRYEVKDDFKFDDSKRGNKQDYFLTRLRISLKWEPAEWISFFVEAQDAHIFGESTIDEKAVPQIFQNTFDLHQGYVDLKGPIGGVPVRLRIGRQKIALGAQRLVSPLEWVNTARVNDGARLTIGKDKVRTLDIFSSRLVAQDDGNWDDWAKTKNRYFSSDFHGVYYTDWKTVPNSRIEGYWLIRHESKRDDLTHTLGGRIASKFGAFDINLEMAGQVGEFDGDDHRAWAVHFGMGYTVKELANSRFGVAYNFASGDSNPRDGDHTTFDNLYPLNHAYYGYMDFFSWQNMHNLEATWKAKLFGKLVTRIAYHAFWLVEENNDAWYNAGTGVVRRAKGDVSPYVGSEVDLTMAYEVFDKHFWVVVGYSHFFTGDYVRDTGDADDADFFFIQTLLKF